MSRIFARFFGLSFLAVVGFFAVLPNVIAQTAGTGALTGTVTDPTGAVVANAMVTATNVDTGQSRSVTTGTDGTYKVNLLPPGSYRVRFEAPGFKPVEVPSATVNVTETAVLDRALTVGGQEQVVTVEGDVEAIQTASAALGTVVSTATVTELPLNTRNYTNLLTMSSGANANVTNASSVGKGGTLISVNGGGTAQNTYLQDGVTINNWYSLGTGTEGTLYGSFAVPNPDSIAEFKIQTSTYDASYGRNPGANVNVVTKSGTNAFHGAAFEFFRNSALNANDWFRNATSGSKLVDNQNQYGGVFGGRIKKDKLFFFVSYQETGQKNGITGYGYSTANLPPMPTGNRGSCPAGWTLLTQCDAAGQAFVPALAGAVCPANNPNASGDKSKAGSISVLCAPTLASPLANINPVAISILQLKLPDGSYMIPSPPAGTRTNAPYVSQTFSDPAIFKDHQFLGNFDYVINNKHTLSARYEYEKDPLLGTFAVQNATVIGNNFPGNPVTTTKTNHAAVLKLTSILSNNLVNEARVSYQRYVTFNTELGPFHNSQVGVTNLRPDKDYLSYFTVNGVGSFGANNFYDAFDPENQFEFADQISWTHGKHTIRSGFEGERVQLFQNYPSLASGNPVFNTFGDFLIGRCGNVPGCANSNGTTSSSLLSIGSNSAANAGFNFNLRVTDLSAFIQDDIKLTPKLTVNVGVRWEYDGYPSEKNGLVSNFWPSLTASAPVPGTSAATGTLVGFIVPNNYNGILPAGILRSSRDDTTPHGPPLHDFAPRVGFAWQPTGNARWVVRGGAGYFYDAVPGSTIGNPVTLTTPGVGFPASGGAALAPGSLADPWVLPQTVSAGPGTFGFTPRWVNPNGQSSNISMPTVGENLTVPVTYEWNLNTQYEFLPNWVLELGYVGSHGIHQSVAIPYNTALIVSPSSPDSRTGTVVATNTSANVPLRVSNLGISATDTQLSSQGSYKYNSLQATVRRQLSHGLQLQAAYTWSRAFTAALLGENVAPYSSWVYGANPSYHPHRVVLSYVWNLPLGHPKGFLGRVAQGWTWSGVTTIQNGTPLTITDTRGGTVFTGGSGGPTSTAQLCPGMTYANIATSGSAQQRVGGGLSTNGFFNASAFCTISTAASLGIASTDTSTMYGNSGQGVVLGPGQNNWDMSLTKSFSIREGQNLQFRSEFFNVWNHPQFNNPVTTVSSSNFGQISSTSVNPRIIQFALKYTF